MLTAFFISLAGGQERLQLCAACHGEDGNSANPQVPSIAGQPKLFLETQLVLFREELRKSDQMAPVVRGLKDPEIIREQMAAPVLLPAEIGALESAVIGDRGIRDRE